MKLSEFKESITERLILLKASIVFTAQRELAYAGKNWISLLSTTLFTLSVLIFANVLYSNVHQIAGYSKNDMLFYFFICQMSYYANWIFTVRNLNDLIPEVNNGNLDMVLVKPVPSLFFLMTRTISLVSIATDAIVPTIAIALSISWQSLEIVFPHFVIGLVVWILGLMALHTYQILAALPVFWFGESENILNLASSVASGEGTLIPFEGYSKNLQFLLSTLIPVLIASGFTTSIILGKANIPNLLVWAVVIGIASVYIKNAAWKFALKHYTSASS